jgi:hypothetical protein
LSLFLKVKRLEHKANKFLSVAKISNECNCTATPTTDLILLCVFKHRDSFIFICDLFNDAVSSWIVYR